MASREQVKRFEGRGFEFVDKQTDLSAGLEGAIERAINLMGRKRSLCVGRLVDWLPAGLPYPVLGNDPKLR